MGEGLQVYRNKALPTEAQRKQGHLRKTIKMQIGLCWSKSARPVNRVPALSSLLISGDTAVSQTCSERERDF